MKVFIKDCISSDLTSFVTSSGDVAAGFTEKDSMAGSICSSNHSNSASSAFLAHKPSLVIDQSQLLLVCKAKLSRVLSGQSETSMEMTRGPRGRYNNFLLKPSLVKDALVITICKDEYNLSDFQTEYETAKFNVIKSFNEDEVHKSVKYNVWTSTPNGNKKLNAAFLDAEAKLRPTGTKCPVFLFFSVSSNLSSQVVNASRQFVGVAEILGPFVHIILPSNENKPVTYTRDTQERREKLFRSQRSTKHARPEQGVYGNDNYQNTVEAREKKIEMQSSGTKQGTLAKLTKNLTLNSSGFR
ncbi:YTH domain-containing family protein 2 [Glycine soja]